MNFTENLQTKQPGGNLPVFFTGLTESVKNEPKMPLLCILCGSSLASNTRNVDNSTNNGQNSKGCENCAKNFENLKKALSLLSNISPSSATSPIPSSQFSNDKPSSSGLKRKALLPIPKPSSDEHSPNEDNIESSHNKEKKQLALTPNSRPDLKRKVVFEDSAAKKPRSDQIPHVTSNNFVLNVHNDKLSKSIWHLFYENKQTQEVYDRKMALRDKLHEILLTRFPSCGLYVVGSSMTGLGGNSSDMDMCLMLTDEEIDQEKEATNILHIIRTLFLNYNFLVDVEVIYAKVPIIRFTDCISRIEVDLNINNSVGIRNTQLLSSYARTDSRLPPLILLVKMWSRCYGINDAKNNTLSSYSLVLMVIHYLQYGCQPPVLPCLQELQPEKYQPHSDVRKLKLFEDLSDFISENDKNIGELFIGFLKYFANDYDYFRSVMSIRLGSILPKETAMNTTFSPKNKKGHWKWVCIEEPFDLTNTACAVFKPGIFRYMKQVFLDSWNKLRRSKDLSSIMD